MNSSHNSQDDWRPTATWDILRHRAELLLRLRAFFVQRGFLEVETPLLSGDTVVDRHLDPFVVPLDSPAGGARRFLQTSPEFAMKRLLAAGTAGNLSGDPRFRREESGAWHNPNSQSPNGTAVAIRWPTACGCFRTVPRLAQHTAGRASDLPDGLSAPRGNRSARRHGRATHRRGAGPRH